MGGGNEYYNERQIRLAGGVYELVPTTVADGRIKALLIDNQGRLVITVGPGALLTVQGSQQEGVAYIDQSLGVGGKYETAPTAVADGEFKQFLIDENGRLVVTTDTTDPVHVEGTQQEGVAYIDQSLGVGGKYEVTPTAVGDNEFKQFLIDENGRLVIATTTALPLTIQGNQVEGVAYVDQSLGVGGKYELTPTSIADGEFKQFNINEFGEQILAGFDRVLTANRVYKTNTPQITTTEIVIFFDAVAGTGVNQYSSSRDSFLWRFWHIQADLSVPDNAASADVAVQVRMDDLEWHDYTVHTFPPITVGSYPYVRSHDFFVVAPAHQLRVRLLETVADVILDCKGQGRVG